MKRAVGGRALVSGSIGPSGQLLEPYGDTSPDAVEEAFAEQARALAAAGADVLCIETMGDLTEAARAVKAAKTVAPGVPVMATMTFEPTPRGFFTVMGVERREGGAPVSRPRAPTSSARTAAPASTTWSRSPARWPAPPACP